MPTGRLWRGFALTAGRTLRTGAAALLTFGLISAVARAQQTQSPATNDTVGKAAPKAELPSARSVLDRHVAAIGGKAAVLGHTSSSVKGTLSMPAAGITGSLEVYEAKPNKSLVRITLAGVGQVSEGFDGTYAWSHSPMTGPMLLDGRQLEEKKFDSDFHGELRDDSRYASMITLEQTEFAGRQCYKVRLVRKTGGEDIEFYDVATGLKAGSVTTRETHMGKVTGTMVESEYRKFGNLLQPTMIKNQVAGVEQVITITHVEYDSVPDSVFAMPAEIKALVK